MYRVYYNPSCQNKVPYDPNEVRDFKYVLQSHKYIFYFYFYVNVKNGRDS